jgi:hypothetical protein
LYGGPKHTGKLFGNAQIGVSESFVLHDVLLTRRAVAA